MGQDAARSLFVALHGDLWPGTADRFHVDKIVSAALAGEVARIEPLTDWPYIYIDDAAHAAVAACFSKGRRQLSYFIAHPEQVTPEDIAAAAAAAGKPVRLEIDTSKPVADAGPVDTEAPHAISGFAPKSAIAKAFAA